MPGRCSKRSTKLAFIEQPRWLLGFRPYAKDGGHRVYRCVPCLDQGRDTVVIEPPCRDPLLHRHITGESTSFRTALRSKLAILAPRARRAAAGGSLRCPVIHRAAAMPVHRRAARPLPPRSQGRDDRALDGVLEIVNRVHGPPG